MKKTMMTLATLTLALSSSLAFARPVQSTGTKQQNVNQYHDRTPHVHERGTSLPR